MLEAIPVARDGKQLTREELAAGVAQLTGIKGLDGKLKGGFGDRRSPRPSAATSASRRATASACASHGPKWLGPWEPMDTEEATREVARHYLTRYGPAGREALARWFGMPSPAEAGRWLKRLGDEAVEAVGEHMLAADVLPAAARERVYRPRGWLSPVVPVDGRMAGIWSHERSGDRLVVEVEPFGRLSRAHKAEGEALAGFLGGRLELRLS